jgi:hypothetical protein
MNKMTIDIEHGGIVGPFGNDVTVPDFGMQRAWRYYRCGSTGHELALMWSMRPEDNASRRRRSDE